MALPGTTLLFVGLSVEATGTKITHSLNSIPSSSLALVTFHPDFIWKRIGDVL